ncbi:hypothetical protein ABC733_02825 [Mangrovibacter sp. SLW1]
MKLVRYTRQGQTRIGKVTESGIVDLTELAGCGSSMRQVLQTLPVFSASLSKNHYLVVHYLKSGLKPQYTTHRNFWELG